MRISEDAVWRYYNCPNPVWSKKCRACREKVNTERVPVAECVDCWKLEIWKHGTAFSELGEVDFDILMDLMERTALSLGHVSVIAKASRAPIQVVRTGIPVTGYSDLVVDDVLVLYAGSIAERRALRRLIQAALGLTDEATSLIPIRRGCWRFDSILGPWQKWHPEESDWVNAESEEPGASSGRPSGDGQIQDAV